MTSEFQHYFWDLPFWALGHRSLRRWERMRSFLHEDATNFRAGLNTLISYQEGALKGCSVETATERALLVRVARESDAFSCIDFAGFKPHFDIYGLEHLQSAMKEKRPIVLLSGHVGSYYTISVALNQVGIKADIFGRSVSPINSLARRSYERANYFFTQRAFKDKWIYSDYSGKLDRRLVRVFRDSGILAVAIDLPRSLFAAGRHQVTFLGKKSSLPARTIELGVKNNALFLVVWNKIELQANLSFRRCLRIEPKIIDTSDVDEILQLYSDSLSTLVFNEPWQWNATQIVSLYDETGKSE